MRKVPRFSELTKNDAMLWMEHKGKTYKEIRGPQDSLVA